jgi:hypothetical protein
MVHFERTDPHAVEIVEQQNTGTITASSCGPHIYGDRTMPAHRNLAAAFSTLLTACLCTPAVAVQVDLFGSYANADVAVDGELHGDLSGNVLTLNASAPTSTLSMTVTTPIPPTPLPTYTQSVDCIVVTCNVTINPHASVLLNLADWNFGVGGSLDLSAGTADLTATPLDVPPVFATLSGTSTPTFGVDVDSTLLQGAADVARDQLNGAGAHLSLSATGYWQSIELGQGTVSSSQTGDDIVADLALASSLFTGYLDYNLNLSFENPSSITGLTLGVFENQVEAQLRSSAQKLFINYISDLAYSEDGRSMDCAGQYAGSQRISVTCAVAGVYHYEGSMNSVSVPEPGTLGLMSLSLAAVGFSIYARRRRLRLFAA